MRFQFTSGIDWGDILTAGSLIVAIVLGVVGYLSSRKASIRAHTINLLAMISSIEKLAESDFQMTRLINTGTRLSGNDIDDSTDRYVINLLDFYEFLATSWTWGAVDKAVLVHVRGGAMSRAYDVCEQYIADRRKSLDAPNLYSNLQKLVTQYPRSAARAVTSLAAAQQAAASDGAPRRI